MAKQPDQIGGEGVTPSKSAGVRAAVKAAQPTIEANREHITKVQTAAFNERKKKRKKKVVSNTAAKPANEGTVARGVRAAAEQGSTLTDLIKLGKGKPR